MSTEQLHFVSVRHEHTDFGGTIATSELIFECRGTIDSPCHLYPEDAESFEAVPREQWTKNEDCWLKTWFDLGYGATMYIDDGGELVESLGLVPAGSGPIEYEYDDGLCWTWVYPA